MVRLDAGRSHGLGDDGRAASKVPADQDSSGRNAVLLCHLLDGSSLHDGSAGAAEGTVGSDDDALSLAEVDDLLLGEKRVVLDLVDGGDDLGLLEELLEVLDAVVGDTDSLDLAGVKKLLHRLPCVDVSPVLNDITRAVLLLREERVVALKDISAPNFVVKGYRSKRQLLFLTVSVQWNRPVNKVQIHVVETQILQRLVDTLLDTLVIAAPELGGDENVFSLDTGSEGFLQALTNFLLVLVAQRTVDVSVARLDGVSNGLSDLAGARLPCS